MKARRVVTWAARLVVAGVFLAAAIPKLLDPAAFARTIANVQAFPHWTWNILAVFVPALELVASAAVLAPRPTLRRAGALILGVLTLAFTVLIASLIIRGIDASCGCFGRDEAAAAAGWPDVARDLALLGAIFLAAWDDFRPRAQARES